MLICSIGVSFDGFITDRDRDFDWGAPNDELVRFNHEGVRELDGYLLGRRLHETMLVWETDPAMRATPANDDFANVWQALPKVVFSRTLDDVVGSARLAQGSLADEIAAMDGLVSIGGADLIGQALELGLLDELRIFRYPVIVGGGTPLLPPVAERIELELLETRTFDSGVIWERYRNVSAGRSTGS